MKTNPNYVGSVSPVAYVAKSRQRLKQYEDTVYLKNGDEFEIELFNPTNNKVSAKIELNSVSIGPGIVLRPGERVFLDRYVTEARKFLFETYKVNGDNKEVQKAIEQNGDLVVKFYKEQVIVQQYPNYGAITISGSNYSPGFYTTSKGFSSGSSTTLNLNSSSVNSTSSCFTSSVDFAPDDKQRSCNYSSSNIPTMDYLGSMDMEQSRGIVDMGAHTNSLKKRSMSKSIQPKEIETGRVEKGSESDQLFKGDYSKFQTAYSWISEWKLLPESRKEVTIEDLVEYCTKCGRKKKKNEIYCSKCGNKF